MDNDSALRVLKVGGRSLHKVDAVSFGQTLFAVVQVSRVSPALNMRGTC